MFIIQRPAALFAPYPFFFDNVDWDYPEERFLYQRRPQISNKSDFESSINLALSLFGGNLGYDVHDVSSLRRENEVEIVGAWGQPPLLDESNGEVDRGEEARVQREIESDEQDLVPEIPPVKKDKGKARAVVQEELPPAPHREEPQTVEYDPSFWDQFGGIGALEEEDAMVRQLQLFQVGETAAYPGEAQLGVPGPSGTKHEDHTDLTAGTTLVRSEAVEAASNHPIKW
ncbi:hypothetical protein FRC04_000566 [Tulasnella sp. 424]|nr:hypothetical protein FRC04_000566 [Tulasnella sp. 424]KAG8967915.1 hypothetical protein FRC05_001880 [Tulasnella sp. 425]